MGLQIRRAPHVRVRIITTLFAAFALIAQPLYGVATNYVANALATTAIPLSSTAALNIDGGETKTVTADASSYSNVKLSFHYNADKLEAGEHLTYGWSVGSGAVTTLGTINGVTGNHEEGDMPDIALPAAADVNDLTLSFSSTGSNGSNDAATVNDISLNGEKNIPAPVASIVAEDFDTWDNSPNFKGFNVGFKASNFGNISAITVDITRADGTQVVKTAGPDIRAWLSNNAHDQASASFVVNPGTANGLTSDSWWSAQTDEPWTAATAPTSATISVTDQNGTKTATNSVFLQGDGAHPSYASLLPPVVVPAAPSAPTDLYAQFQYDSSHLNSGTTLNKTAESGGNNLELEWTAPSGNVTGYHLLSNNPDGTSNVGYQGPNTNAWLVSNGFGQHGNGKYTYQVVAVNNDGSSTPSSEFTLYFDTQSPTAIFSTAPDNNSFQNGNFDVSATISDSARLSGASFDVRDPSDTTGNAWRAGCVPGTLTESPSPIAGSQHASLSCTINTKSLVSGHTYYVRIHAGDYAGYGSKDTAPESMRYFIFDTSAPVKPSNLQVKYQYDTDYLSNGAVIAQDSKPGPYMGNNLELTWNDGANDWVTGHHIYVTWPDHSTHLAYQGPNTNAWLVSDGFGQHGDGTYIFQVEAVNGNGTAKSDEVFALTYDTTPPTGVFTFSNGNNVAKNEVVTLKTNEPLQQIPSGWTQPDINDATTFTKLYTQDGKYTVDVKDMLGNAGTLNFEVKRIDTTDPVIGGVSDGDIRNINLASFTVTDQNFDQYPGGVTVDGNNVTCTKPTSGFVWTCPAVNGDATHTIIATDKAGNSAKVTFTIDTIKPAVPTITAPGARTWHNMNITDSWTKVTKDVSGTNENIDHYQIAYIYDNPHTFAGSTCDNETIAGKAVSGCRDTTGTSRVHAPAPTEQGGVTIYVRAIDTAGNMSDWSHPVHYYYDIDSPTVQITSPVHGDAVSSAVNGNTLTVTGMFKDNLNAADYMYLNLKNSKGAVVANGILYGNGVAHNNPSATYTDNDGSFTYKMKVPADLASGTYTISYSGHDMANNPVSGVSNAFTIDNDAPTVPSDLSWLGTGNKSTTNGYTNVQKGTLSWADTDASIDHYVYKFWTNINGYFDGQSNAWDTEATNNRGLIQQTGTGGSIWTNFDNKEGMYSFCVAAVDAAGNESHCSDTYSVTYDATAPQGTFTYSATPAQSVTVTLTPTEKLSATPTGWTYVNDTEYTKVFSSESDNGSHTATLTDQANNSTDLNFTVAGIDTTAPDAPKVLLGAVKSGMQTVTADPANANVTFTYDNGVAVDSNLIAQVGGVYTVDTSAMQKGTKITVSATSTDAAGNTSKAGKTVITVENGDLSPVVTIAQPTLGQGGNYTISGTSTAVGKTVTVTLTNVDGTQSFSPTTDANGTWSFSTPLRAATQYVITASTTDQYGYGGNAKSVAYSVPAVKAATVANPNAPLFHQFASATSPVNVNSAPKKGSEAILGAQDTKSSDKGVLGDTAALTPSSQGWKIFGFAWYWWLLLIAAVVALWWFLAARRRSSDTI